MRLMQPVVSWFTFIFINLSNSVFLRVSLKVSGISLFQFRIVSLQECCSYKKANKTMVVQDLFYSVLREK